MSHLEFDPGDDRSMSRAEYEKSRRLARTVSSLMPTRTRRQRPSHRRCPDCELLVHVACQCRACGHAPSAALFAPPPLDEDPPLPQTGP